MECSSQSRELPHTRDWHIGENNENNQNKEYKRNENKNK